MSYDVRLALQAAFLVACTMGANYSIYALYAGMVFVGFISLLLVLGLGCILAFVLAKQPELIKVSPDKEGASTGIRLLSSCAYALFAVSVYMHGYAVLAGFFTFTAGISVICNVMLTILQMADKEA